MSVISQLLPDDELIIIDDGSTDDTLMVARNLAEQQASVRVYTQENKGPSYSRNRGYEQSRNQYLLFLDADDELVENALQNYRDAVLSNPGYKAYFARHITVFSPFKQKLSGTLHLTNDYRKNFLNFLFYKKLSFANGAILLDRQIMQQIQYPEYLRTAEDISFNALILANYPVFAINEPLLKVYKHENSLRHQHKQYLVYAKQVTAEIFNEQLPKALHKYKHHYEAIRLLSIFRILYLEKDYQAAIKKYLRLIKMRPSLIFRTSYLSKFIKSLLLVKKS